MKRMRVATIGMALLCTALALPRPAQAQTTAWGQSGYVSFNALYDAASRAYTTVTEQTINQESARLTARHTTGSDVLFDFTSGGRIVGLFGVGFAATYGKGTTDAQISGEVPHPFFFNQPRALSGFATLDREDLAIHVSAMWLLPVTRTFQMAVFAGPTWFKVKHDVVSAIEVEDAYPFDTVTLGSVTGAPKEGSRVGYHAGADASYFFNKHVGVHGLARYSDGSVKLEDGSGTIKAGGLHIGGGLRIRY